MVSFIVFWEVMLRGLWSLSLCGLLFWEVMLREVVVFHCVLGGYVERLWSLSLCFGRLC